MKPPTRVTALDSAYVLMASEAQALSVKVREQAAAGDWSAADDYLNGAISGLLRSKVALAERRKNGVYFTDNKIGRLIAETLGPLTEQDVVVDPTCGAGDLLLQCAAQLPLKDTLEETVTMWSMALSGTDLEPQFVSLARDRLLVLASRLHDIEIPKAEPESSDFPLIKPGDYRGHRQIIQQATAIASNPPFAPVRLEQPRAWGSGQVNLAAVVVEDIVSYARNGTKLAIVVPEVLRSGSRYVKWRALIRATVQELTYIGLGRFDPWTDVDVALLSGVVGPNTAASNDETAEAKLQVGHEFSISVGPLVEYRDPKRGPWRNVVRSRNLSAPLGPKRRFSGRIEKPPFLAISRTSSPSDIPRIKGRVFHGDEPLAIENHVLVIRHPDDDAEALEQLLEHLQSEAITGWLNEHLRLRHLTVSAVRRAPMRT